VIRDPGTRELEKVGVYMTSTPPIVPAPEITEGEPSAVAIVPEPGVGAVRKSMYEGLEMQGILAPVSRSISLTLGERGLLEHGLRQGMLMGEWVITLASVRVCGTFGPRAAVLLTLSR